MPIISRFFGIAVALFWNDHVPPHFHARYGEHEAIVNIENGLSEGYLPPRAMALVQEWRKLHVKELEEDWELARLRKALKLIKPLE